MFYLYDKVPESKHGGSWFPKVDHPAVGTLKVPLAPFTPGAVLCLSPEASRNGSAHQGGIHAHHFLSLGPSLRHDQGVFLIGVTKRVAHSEPVLRLCFWTLLGRSLKNTPCIDNVTDAPRFSQFLVDDLSR